MDTVLQLRDKLDPKFVMGKGKLDEVVLRAAELDVDNLIFDRNLTPSQAAAITTIPRSRTIRSAAAMPLTAW